MTDQPEKKSETEEVDADFEGHRLSGPERASRDITDVKAANEDDGADFEGHRLSGRRSRQAQADSVPDVKA